VGAVLPPPQETLEADYKRELAARFGVHFNALFTITNMPISRFGAVLLSHGEYDAYMRLLRDNYTDANLATVMCRNLVSIDWQGFLYDCDFNQMLALPLQDSPAQRGGALASDRARTHISELDWAAMAGRRIATGDHCYGCTAGQGSSCGGAL
jgi:radical SAM/Cys-rich protein